MKKEIKKGKIAVAALLTGAVIATSAFGLTNYTNNRKIQNNTNALIAECTYVNDITNEYGLVIEDQTRIRDSKNNQTGKLYTDKERILKTYDGLEYIYYFDGYYTEDGKTLYKVTTDKQEEVEYTYVINTSSVGEDATTRTVTNVKTGEETEIHEYFFWLQFGELEEKIIDEEKQTISIPEHQVVRITTEDPRTLTLPANETITDIEIIETKTYDAMGENIYYGERQYKVLSDGDEYPYTLSR